MLSVFFSFCLLLGASYYEFDSWKFVFSNRFQFFCSVFASSGYSILLYACLKHLFNIFDRHKSIDFVSQKERQSVLAKLTSWFFRHPFLAPYLAIGATWGATLCIFLPGSVSWDGFWQLNQFFSVPMPDAGNPVYFEPSNHQPYFATCIIGSLMQIGRSLGSDSLGILFVVVVQSTICLSVYASVIALQIRLLLPRALSLGTTAFFALCPIWASYAQAIEKDTLFAAFFCLFSLALFNILRNRSDPRLIDSRTWLALAFSSVMVCIFRNNGLWAILPTFILLVIALRPLRRKILLSLGSGILLSISLIFVCLPLIGIPKGSSGEALSIPFQQTARYLTEYPDDVTPDQMAKINNVLAGDSLAALYNPELSDPVKGTFKSDATTEDLLAYGTVWLEMLAQHPDSYIQATLNNTFGYLYPSGVFDDHVDTYFFATNTSPTINTGYFDTNYCFDSTERIREIVVDASYVLERVPVLGDYCG